MEPMLKCRFCDWMTLKYRTRKDGVRVPGWGKLMAHVELEHSGQAEEITETLGTQYVGELNEEDN